ncbi:glycerophosphodiester phosphodiesterase [Halobaculum sp. CBA1158]|uniref:glycerophosphodiester phosphodiesterase n=1 Tax=Halobaculum sp. CBA1158 TaxID=2904243 RepID=UPI001F2A103C|nr:glycerophosphodiester phosphodiesterase [Halobaculum sp. CBA1158]UIO98568.1 glycerophosphodiester phosphodiesterase [Halobaculum sp. CBA1158]
MRVVGHRGCPELYPENTALAFGEASARCDWIEFDVRRCGSGEPVVLHDETLARTVGVERAVADLSLSDLRAYSVGDSDEPVPTLAAALAAVPEDTVVNVELKEEGLAEAVADAADRVGNEVVVSSFSPAALRATQAASGLPIATVTMDPDAWEDTLALATELDAEYVHPRYDLLFSRPTRVAEAHDRGLDVNAWTLRSAEPFDRVAALGVDGVIVDDPAYAGR